MQTPFRRFSPLFFVYLVLVGAITSAGCAWQQRKAARLAYLQQQVEPYELEQSLDEAWPSALRLLANAGFPLVGLDRELVDQTGGGFLSGLFDAGFETRLRGQEGLEAETNWSQDKLRYRIEGRRLGADRCRITLGVMHKKEHYERDDLPVRDYEMELNLIELLDADAGAKMRAGAEEAARSI